MNYLDIILLKYPNIQGVLFWHTKPDGSDWEDEYEGLVWENKDIAKPTKAELNKWKKEFDLLHRQQQAVAKRQYKSWQEQLDMQYHDAMNGTTTWLDYIKSVKEANPKPM